MDLLSFLAKTVEAPPPEEAWLLLAKIAPGSNSTKLVSVLQKALDGPDLRQKESALSCLAVICVQDNDQITTRFRDQIIYAAKNDNAKISGLAIKVMIYSKLIQVRLACEELM